MHGRHGSNGTSQASLERAEARGRESIYRGAALVIAGLLLLAAGLRDKRLTSANDELGGQAELHAGRPRGGYGRPGAAWRYSTQRDSSKRTVIWLLLQNAAR
jgi:hypothetical protein